MNCKPKTDVLRVLEARWEACTSAMHYGHERYNVVTSVTGSYFVVSDDTGRFLAYYGQNNHRSTNYFRSKYYFSVCH